MTTKKTAELVPVTKTLTALSNLDSLKDIVKINMAGRAAAWTDLERIKVPSGGAPIYMIENELDGIKTAESFEAVMCWFNDARTWWEQSIEEGGAGNPPACTSKNLRVGAGNNGVAVDSQHDCDLCPNNRFGPNAVDTKNWCKETRQLFVIRLDNPGSFFPSVLVAPPTSLKPITKYMMQITSRGVPFFGAVHNFTLTPEQNKDGIAYSAIKMNFVRGLDEAETAAMKGYAEAMQPTFGELRPVDQN